MFCLLLGALSMYEISECARDALWLIDISLAVECLSFVTQTPPPPPAPFPISTLSLLRIMTRLAQEVLIEQLQRKLTQLSRNPSPAIGPVNPGTTAAGLANAAARKHLLDMDELGLGLAALGEGGNRDADDQETTTPAVSS